MWPPSDTLERKGEREWRPVDNWQMPDWVFFLPVCSSLARQAESSKDRSLFRAREHSQPWGYFWRITKTLFWLLCRCAQNDCQVSVREIKKGSSLWRRRGRKFKAENQWRLCVRDHWAVIRKVSLVKLYFATGVHQLMQSQQAHTLIDWLSVSDCFSFVKKRQSTFAH